MDSTLGSQEVRDPGRGRPYPVELQLRLLLVKMSHLLLGIPVLSGVGSLLTATLNDLTRTVVSLGLRGLITGYSLRMLVMMR